MNVLLERTTLQPPLGAPPAHELWCAIASLSLGGAEKMVLDWARRVAPPWRVHLVVLRDRAHEWPVPAGVRVISTARTFGFSSMRRMTSRCCSSLWKNATSYWRIGQSRRKR